MRKNKIELRKNYEKNGLFEVVKWYDNPNFNRQNEYIQDGDFYHNGNNLKIHISCFLIPESCHVISYIENGISEFVGDRLSELETFQELNDFIFLLRKGIKKSIRWKETASFLQTT